MDIDRHRNMHQDVHDQSHVHNENAPFCSALNAWNSWEGNQGPKHIFTATLRAVGKDSGCNVCTPGSAGIESSVSPQRSAAYAHPFPGCYLLMHTKATSAVNPDGPVASNW